MKNGILLVDKPKGMTSRDVVNIISKRLKTKKVGHTGTLDPNATGLMLICVNKATSLVELITSEDKEYIATVKMGMLTDTLDIDGNILKENYNYQITKDELEKTLNSFLGSYLQEVPLYSAIKINGMKLYEYARKNKDVSLPKRLVTIKKIKLLDFNENVFSFKVCVSKGTYIRSLIRDVGNKLNILMTLSELRRTKINQYDVLDAINPNEVVEDDLIKIEDFLSLPKIYVNYDLEKKIRNGVRLKNNEYSSKVMFLNEEGVLLGIYQQLENGEMGVYKLF